MKKKIKIVKSFVMSDLEKQVNEALKALPSDTKVTFSTYAVENGYVNGFSVCKVATLEYLYDQVEEEINDRMEAFGKEKMAEKFANYPEKWWNATTQKWESRDEVMRIFAEKLIGSQEWKDKMEEVTKEVKENV